MSNINPNNINGNYPIAGQDNDSQGLRDNFTNVKNNLTIVKNELEDLQNKVLLKQALTGLPFNNQMLGAEIPGQVLSAAAEKVNAITTTSGAVPISWTEGHFQYIGPTANVALNFTAWPTSGQYGKMRLQATPTVPGVTITFPAEVTTISSGVANIANLVITCNTTSTRMYELSTYDNGINITLIQLV